MNYGFSTSEYFPPNITTAGDIEMDHEFLRMTEIKIFDIRHRTLISQQQNINNFIASGVLKQIITYPTGDTHRFQASPRSQASKKIILYIL